jgi:hypothetical protein
MRDWTSTIEIGSDPSSEVVQKMRSSKIIIAAVVLSMVAWVSPQVWAQAWAGHDSYGKGRGHSHSTAISGGGTQASSHHDGTKGHGHKHGAAANSHSNKGGAERGLTRANQVAGEHGEEGRENASAHHSGDKGSSHDAQE